MKMNDTIETILGAILVLIMWGVGAFFSALPFLLVIWYLKH